MAKEHLTFNREEPVTIKRPRKMSIPRPVLTDVIGHGQRMLTSLATAKETAQLQNQGFDNRLLFKIVISDIEGANLDSIPGVELISQEDRGIFLVFSSEGAIDEFEARLTMLVEGGVPTRKSLLEALEGFKTIIYWIIHMALERSIIKPTEAELALLNILWTIGPATVKKVHEIVSSTHKTGYTTVLKTLQIMHDKSLVIRDETNRAHVYSTAISETQTQSSLLNDLINKAFRGSTSKLLIQAIEELATVEDVNVIRKILLSKEQANLKATNN